MSNSSSFPRETRLKIAETVTFQEGYIHEIRGYFCRVEKENFCVEDFAQTKRAALRITRRAWSKLRNKKFQEDHGLPKVVNCEE